MYGVSMTTKRTDAFGVPAALGLLAGSFFVPFCLLCATINVLDKMGDIGNRRYVFLTVSVLFLGLFFLLAWRNLWRCSGRWSRRLNLAAMIASPLAAGVNLLMIFLLLPTAEEMINTAIQMQYMIAGSLNRYEDAYGKYPPHRITPDAQGNPPHSWRVYLLPQLGYDELFDQIRLDEPWDSEWNRQFHTRIIPDFRRPGANLKPGETTYSLIVGGPSFFPTDGEGPTRAEVPGSAILVTESSPGCWMDPNHDILYEDAIQGVNCLPTGIISYGGSASERRTTFAAARFDGSVARIPIPATQTQLRKEILGK